MLCFNRLRKECLRRIIRELNLHLGILFENRLYRRLQRLPYIHLTVVLDLITLSTILIGLREIVRQLLLSALLVIFNF